MVCKNLFTRWDWLIWLEYIGKDEEGDQVDDDGTRLNFSWRTEDKKYKLVK